MVLAVYRAAFAILVVAAIAAQLADLVSRGVFNFVGFFSYFTIESNLIGVAAFVIAIRWQTNRPHWVDLVRGASTVYLTITFVVFAILLSNTDVDTALPWVDLVLHKIFPIVVIADWLIDPPALPITARQAAFWIVYPLAWVAYALTRGAFTGHYPYPFLDPANGGYGTVALYIVGIFLLGMLVIAVVAAVARLRGRGSNRRA